MSKTFTYSDVSEHTAEHDLYMVIHDKVYDASSFVDEHPGGEEVMIDVGGQDASEAFEDVGHSGEARGILEGLLIGTIERKEGDPQPKTHTAPVTSMNNKSDSLNAGMGVGVYAIVLVGAVVAFFGYQYLQGKSSPQLV